MDTMKKFVIYALILIAFFIFSNFLIFVGLNANYDSISSKGSMPSQIEVTRAEATLVNGRIYGTIKNNSENDLNNKYIKIDLYTKRDVLVGTKYLQMTDMAPDTQEEFKTYFKAQDVEYYNMSIVNEAETVDADLEVFINEDMKTYAIIGTLILLILI